MRKGQAILAASAVIVVLAAAATGIYLTQYQPASANITVTQVAAPLADPTVVQVADSTATPPRPVTGASNGAPTTTEIAQTSPRPGATPGTVRGQHGDWQLSCDTPPGASFEQCAIIQNVTAEDQPNVGLSVIVLKTADNRARLLRVLAPLGVLLPNGLGLNVDGNDLGRVAFVRCLPNGCVAEVVMDDTLLNTLSTGSSAIFIVFKTPEEGIGIPVSLNGFAEGFAALP